MHALTKTDPKIAELIKKETERQENGIEMIASENIASAAVLEAMGSTLTNKYSEGYPGKRYYSGNEIVDEIETLAIERAKELFGAAHANVQPHSGSQANQAAYEALLEHGDTVLAMDLAHGGHLTHGSPVSFSGKTYCFVHYGVRKEDELIDMEALAKLAKKEKPKLIVAGYTAYPRLLDFKKFKEIAESVGAKLMVDMAHFAGLVAAKIHPDPVPHADVITTTTHKTLRGPRGGMVLCAADMAQAVDSAVFPRVQGGPLDHVIAAKAVALGEALEPSFVAYQKQVVKNAKSLAQSLTDSGIRLVTGGTDNHLLLLDLSKLGITGKEAESHLEQVGIYTNRNMIPFDTRKPADPSGLRIGTPAITTRGCDESEAAELGRAIAAVLKKPTLDAKNKAASLVRELTSAHPLLY